MVQCPLLADEALELHGGRELQKMVDAGGTYIESTESLGDKSDITDHHIPLTSSHFTKQITTLCDF